MDMNIKKMLTVAAFSAVASSLALPTVASAQTFKLTIDGQECGAVTASSISAGKITLTGFSGSCNKGGSTGGGETGGGETGGGETGGGETGGGETGGGETGGGETGGGETGGGETGGGNGGTSPELPGHQWSSGSIISVNFPNVNRSEFKVGGNVQGRILEFTKDKTSKLGNLSAIQGWQHGNVLSTFWISDTIGGQAISENCIASATPIESPSLSWKDSSITSYKKRCALDAGKKYYLHITDKQVVNPKTAICKLRDGCDIAVMGTGN